MSRAEMCILVGLVVLGGCGRDHEAVTPTPSPAGRWGSPFLLGGEPGALAFVPQVAVGPTSGALAVWSELGGSGIRVWAARRLGTSWSSARPLSEPLGPTSYPEAAVDGLNTAFAAWNSFVSGRTAIWASRASTAADWEPPALLDAPTEADATGDPFASRPALAATPAGEGFVLWRQVAGSEHRIWARRFVPGAGWIATELVARGSGNASAVRVAVSEGGEALAAWTVSDRGLTEVRASRYVGGAWRPPETLASAAGLFSLAHAPEVALSGTGAGFIVWTTELGGPVWASRFDPAQGWSPPEPLSNGQNALPQVAADARGNAVALWEQWDPRGNFYDIASSRFTAGQGWSAARRLESRDDGASVPQLAVSASGDAFAVWAQADRIWSARFDASSGWGASQTIDLMPRGFTPDIAADASGNAVAVWTQGTLEQARVWANPFVR